jgi:hypothetical protein
LTYSDTFFIILTFDLLLISFLKAFYQKFTKQLFLSVFAQRYANQYLKEENVFTERVTFLVTSIMLLNISLFLSKLIFGHNLEPLNFCKVFLYVSIFYLLKAILIRLLGQLFILTSLSRLGLYFSFLFDRVMGIVLFPLILCMFFSPLDSSQLLITLSVIVIIFFLLVKLFWLWQIGIRSFGLSRYYLFLYLCSLEILPLIVFVKEVFY